MTDTATESPPAGIQEQINANNRKIAAQKLEKVPSRLQSDMVAYSRLRRGVHTHRNAFGQHLSPKEVEIVKKNLDALKERMLKENKVEDEKALELFLKEKGLGDTIVMEELVRRFPEKETG